MSKTVQQTGLLILVLVLSSLTSPAQSESRPAPQRVLLFHHYSRPIPGVLRFDQGFEDAFKMAQPASIDLYRETLESYRFPGGDHELTMRKYLKAKYADRKIDVIVAYTDTALDFINRYRNELFPGVPIVFVVSNRPEQGNQPLLSTGIWAGPNIKDNLELALQLQPATEQVVIVVGDPLSDNTMVESETREELKAFEGRLKLTYLIGHSLDDVLRTVSELPPNSIVLCQRQLKGTGGRRVVARDAVTLITSSSRVPVYGTMDTWIGEGIVGGKVLDHVALGRRAAQMAIKILQGAKPEEMPVEPATIIPMFDWRQLKRWRISEGSLPKGSVVLFADRSFWELYQWHIVVALTLLTAQAMLIAGLLLQRARRARAETSRQISERNLQRLTGQLIHVQDEERRRVAAELHDGIGQTLSIINNRATICLDNLKNEDCLKEQLGEISEVTFAGLDEVREIAHNLRPYELDRLGLVQAVESMVEKVSNSASIQISSEVDDIDGQLSRDAETGIYRILQEGLNNVLKHASASEARVSIKRDGKELFVALSDNGKGFERHPSPNGEGKGFGLAGITERARMLQAKCTIESALGRGTVLRLRIPMNHNVDGQ